MDSQIYAKVQQEFEEKRKQDALEINRKKEAIYENDPLLRTLEDEKNLLAIQSAKKMMTLNDIDKQIEQENLTIRLSKIDEKIEKQLIKNGILKWNIAPNYECNKCQDTGKIKVGAKFEYCTCFKQRVIKEMYKQAGMNKIEEENFHTFDIGYFSNLVDEKKYGMNKSPRENIEKIRDISLAFANRYFRSKAKKLVIYW